MKIQVEFNPAKVAEYRLIGYETRALNREDFNNDRVDAGEIGSGHSVTAIYEITPKGSAGDDDRRSALRRRRRPTMAASPNADEYAFVKIRYKAPDGDVCKLITTPVTEANEVASPSTRRASTSASRSRSRPSARSCATPTRPRSSATTRSSRLPLPREAPTRLGIGRSSFRWCALPRRWIAETGSGDTGSSPSLGTAQADGRCPWVGEAAGEGIVLRRLFCCRSQRFVSSLTV